MTAKELQEKRNTYRDKLAETNPFVEEDAKLYNLGFLEGSDAFIEHIEKLEKALERYEKAAFEIKGEIVAVGSVAREALAALPWRQPK